MDTRCLGLVSGALCTHYKKLTSSGLRLGFQQLALVVRTRFGYAFRRPLESVGGRRCRGCLGQLSSLKTGLVRRLALFRLGNGWCPWWRVRTPRPLSLFEREASVASLVVKNVVPEHAPDPVQHWTNEIVPSNWSSRFLMGCHKWSPSGAHTCAHAPLPSLGPVSPLRNWVVPPLQCHYDPPC